MIESSSEDTIVIMCPLLQILAYLISLEGMEAHQTNLILIVFISHTATQLSKDLGCQMQTIHSGQRGRMA